MRTLPQAGHQAVGLDIKRSPLHQRRRIDHDRSLVRRCMRACSAVLHTATLHKPHVATHSREAFVDDQHQGHADLAGRSPRGGRERLRVYQHDQRVRAGADAAAWGAGGLDHRGRDAGAQEHLRRDEGRRREFVRARSTAAPACRVLFSERRDSSRSRTTAGRRGRRTTTTTQSQRVSVPASGHRGHRQRASARPGESAGDRVRPIHRERDDAVHAR